MKFVNINIPIFFYRFSKCCDIPIGKTSSQRPEGQVRNSSLNKSKMPCACKTCKVSLINRLRTTLRNFSQTVGDPLRNSIPKFNLS